MTVQNDADVLNTWPVTPLCAALNAARFVPSASLYVWMLLIRLCSSAVV